MFNLNLILAVISVTEICSTSTDNATETSMIKLVGWKFKELSQYIVIAVFIFCFVLLKIVHSNVKWLYQYFPESIILLLTGALFGFIIEYILKDHMSLDFNSEIFFYILLPPIVLDASYALATKAFGRVVHFVLLFAFLGTVINFLIIGFSLGLLASLNGFGFQHIDMSLKSLLLFASVIVAVDPVAVLAIFADIGVELDLYFIVFGESLLNDAVTVVLFDLMEVFSNLNSVSAVNYALGVLSFFTVTFGGAFVGLLFGILTCLMTRINNHCEIMTMLLLGYLSYIFGNILQWSGIISLIVCGIIQASYAFHNMGRESLITLRKIISIWCSMSEGLVFIFLGERIPHMSNGWHTGFVMWSLFLCLFARIFVVFSFSFLINIINRRSGRQITFSEQLILSHGGLRGAVAFSLVMMIDSKFVGGENNKNIIICATLSIIIFTVGLQGITMKPLVKLLKINKQTKCSRTLFNTTNESVVNKVMLGIEHIVGEIGQSSFNKVFSWFKSKRIKALLQRNPMTAYEKIVVNFQKLSMAFDFVKTQKAKNATKENVGKFELISNLSSQVWLLHDVISQEKYADILENERKISLINARESNNPIVLINQLNEVRQSKNISNMVKPMESNGVHPYVHFDYQCDETSF